MHGRSRLVLPQLRTAPEDVVRLCREVEPSAELVYMGEGRWMLGEVDRTNAREAAGRYKLQTAGKQTLPASATPAEAARWLARWRFVAYEGLLLTQGFAMVHTFCMADPDSACAEYLRFRKYAWRRDLDAALRRVLHALPDAEQDAKEIAEAHDAAISPLVDEYRLRDAYRHAFKKPVSVLQS